MTFDSQHSPYPISLPKLLKMKSYIAFCGKKKSLKDDLVSATVPVLERTESGGGEEPQPWVFM